MVEGFSCTLRITVRSALRDTGMKMQLGRVWREERPPASVHKIKKKKKTAKGCQTDSRPLPHVGCGIKKKLTGDKNSSK